MSEPMRIDLCALLKAVGDKKVSFVCDSDGEPVSDAKARECLAAYISEGFPQVPMRKDTPPTVRPTKSHTRLERLKRTLAELEREKMAYMRSHYCLNIPAKLAAKIAACKEEIADAEAYIPRRLSQIMPDGPQRKRLIGAIIKTHVAADYYTETLVNVKDELDRAGLHGCNLFTLSDEIERLSQQYADIVCHPEFADLSNMMSTNDKLLKDIDTLTTQYLSDKLPNDID